MKPKLPPRLENHLRDLSEGLTPEKIAAKRGLSIQTVYTYNRDIKKQFENEPEWKNTHLPTRTVWELIGRRYFGQAVGAERAIADAAQQQLAAMPLDSVPDPAPLPFVSRMPFSHNPLFVDREAELRILATAFKTGGSATTSQIVAVTGLVGIGKTQLASAFVHHYGQYFAGGVFWLSFTDTEAIPSEIAECGGVGYLDLRPDFRQLPLKEQVRLVLQEWQSGLPYLLVFDNCEDEQVLDHWRPRTGGSRVLVTSRRMQWDPALGVQTLPLSTLPRPDSVGLLRKFRPDLSEKDSDLTTIAAELGDLPLALHLAGSYLARYRHAITPVAYLAQLRDTALLGHPSLQPEGVLLSTGHIKNVGVTFTVSYQRLDATNPTDAVALKLLTRAAYFAPGELIPRELLLASLSLTDETPGASLQAEDALARLANLGVLEDHGMLRLHRLITTFVLSTVTDTIAQEAVERATITIAQRWYDAGQLVLWPSLQRHLRIITDRARRRNDEQAATLCNLLGNYLHEIQEYTMAKRYYERALEIREVVFGEIHPDVAHVLHNLANNLTFLEDYSGAQHYLERALLIFEQTLGKEHPDTANSIAHLGLVLHNQGKWIEAQSYYERALELRKAILGDNHPDVAWSLNNLGELFKDQGRFAEAVPYYEQAITIHQAAKGDHPFTAVLINNLGETLAALHDDMKARPLLERALEIFALKLGRSHAYTKICLNNLIALLKRQGRESDVQYYLKTYAE